MLYLGYLILGIIVGVFLRIIAERGYRKQYQNYRKFIEQYLNAERVIHAHIREHILRERDLSWAVGLPPIATFGIKADGTLMSEEELAEARRIARETD
jgi:hypothetical protein